MKRLLTSTALLVSLALVLALSACDLSELNENPNAPTEINASYLLTNAQTELAATYYGIFPLGYFANFYSQYWAHTTYPEEQRYQFPLVRGSSNSGMFADYYLIMNDLQEMARIARETPEEVALYGNPQDVIAIAKIQQVWIWQVLTDIYGPVPFDSALAGRDVVRPPYTGQETIYRSLIDTLRTASQQLTGEPALASADLVFDGDTERWRAFANGLRMRVAIRASCAESPNCETAPQYFQDAFVEAYNAGGFTSLAGYQRALIPFGESQPYVNPIYDNVVITGRTDWAVSRTILRVMNENADPRRDAYAELSPDGDYTGLPYGLDAVLLPQYVGDMSLPGNCVAETASEPAILYTESEELFMLAEAAERGWITGSPEQYYNEAIRASMDYWNQSCANVSIPPAAVQAYIDRVPYDNSNGWAPELEEGQPWTQTIGVQKWVALYMQGVQGWSVWRRLDFDNVFVIPPDNPGQTLFSADAPFRLPYPAEEPSLNFDNYDAAVTNFLGGTDTQGVSLWWDDGELGAFLGVAPVD